MKQTSRSAWIALACTVAAIGGCEPGWEANKPALPGSLTPRSRWTATGDLSNARYAVDGSGSTRAVSSGSSYRGESITIDLQRPCTFNLVAIDHGSDEHGYARRVEVSTSFDGRRFTPVHSGPGTRKVTVMGLIKPETARYIRLRAETPGSRPWSVAEVYVQ